MQRTICCLFYVRVVLLFHCILTSFSFINVTATDELTSSPVILTTTGAVRGRVVRAVNGRYAQEFLNIPFAQPPVGALRFRAPKPAEKWQGIRDGTELGNACVQNTGRISSLTFRWALFSLIPESKRINEDCLNLNIHMPFPIVKHHDDQPGLPVLVYIHGGAFRMSGNSVPIHNASILASEINAIIVMPNYRVGALGFFTLKGVDGVNGNQGLMDQSLALQWARDNAANFGGDPNRITLAGVSAGSASVHYHLLSNMSRPLFSQSIMQSGTAMSFWAYQRPEDARESARVFAISADCGADDGDQTLFECMNAKSTQEMVSAAVKLRITSNKHVSVAPTLDGVFMTKSPADHLHAGDFHRGPTIIGSTANESMPLLAMFNPFAVIPQLPNVRLTEDKFNQILDSGDISFGTAARDAIKFVYRNWSAPEDDGGERWLMLNAICDDYLFSNGLIETLNAYLKYGQAVVFRYRFNHKPTKSLWGYQFEASVHGDDIPFFFGHPLDSQYGFTPEEVGLSRRIMHDTKNFVHTGDPNNLPSSREGPKDSKFRWRPYAGRHEYFTIDTRNYGAVGVAPELWRLEFWHRALPYVISLEQRASIAEARDAAAQEPLMDELLEKDLAHRKPPEVEATSFLSATFVPVRNFCTSWLLRALVFVLTV